MPVWMGWKGKQGIGAHFLFCAHPAPNAAAFRLAGLSRGAASREVGQICVCRKGLGSVSQLQPPGSNFKSCKTSQVFIFSLVHQKVTRNTQREAILALVFCLHLPAAGCKEPSEPW